MKTIRKNFRMSKPFDVASIIEIKKFNTWNMSPRTVLNLSSDGFHVQLNRIPLDVFINR